MKRALAFVGIYMMSRESDAQTRYILDDDWQIGITYPFPLDVCLQTAAQVVLTSDAAYTYFTCDSITQTVTKYKWGINEVSDINSGFDCMDGDQIDSRGNVTTINYDATLTSCDAGYFNCVGDDNYATATFKGGFGVLTECPAAPLFSLTTSIATGVCYCNNNTVTGATYGSIECDSTQATTYNWTDNQCTMAGNPDSELLGAAYDCTLFGEPLEVPNPFGEGTAFVTVFGEMTGCTDAGEQIIETTAVPTSAPTEPPTAKPTATPVTSDAHSFFLSFEFVFSVILVALQTHF